MGRVFLIAGALAFVAGAVIAAVIAWASAGPVEISVHGWIALGLGVSLTLALGAGLMGLVFYSSRRGFDDRARGADDLFDDEDGA